MLTNKIKIVILFLIVIVILILFPRRFPIGNKCQLNEDLIDSVHAENCFSSDGNQLITYKNKTYIHLSGRYISDVTEKPVYAIRHFNDQASKQPMLIFEKTIDQSENTLFKLLCFINAQYSALTNFDVRR